MARTFGQMFDAGAGGIQGPPVLTPAIPLVERIMQCERRIGELEVAVQQHADDLEAVFGRRDLTPR